MESIREIVLDIIEALIILGIFQALYDEKKFIIQNKIKSVLFCIVYIFITYCSTFSMTMAYHSLVLVVLDVLVLAYIMKIKIFNSAVIISLFFTIVITTETIIEAIEMFTFNINLSQIFSNSKYFWIFLIPSKILQIIIAILIFKFNDYFIKLRLFEREGRVFANLIIELGVFTIFIFCANFSIFNIKSIQTYNIFMFILYFTFLIVKFKSLKEKEMLVNINNNYKVQKQQIKNMEEIISIIRQEKHDFANHINVIQGLCLLNKPNTVERINNYVKKISGTIHSSFRYLDTGNDYMDGMLSIKNNYAMKNNIDFKVIIDEPFDLIKIREDELISIISNLVDNAFEAFNKSDVENKEISIITFKEDMNFCIEIADNGDEIPEGIKTKIFERGFSTKKEQKDGHGFGLYIIKQLVEKNKGSIFLESTPERTKFTVKFKMED
ncbi:ATP-binding protein [Clostridium kluyveri]|uniref:histidine kinase n=1 Tax=Clostridium kluyveri TaxID=1534 RepID=A0A1L5FCA0_CLOKL|nr:ATP-binding protein [Clostridium kluyveri]APM40638.1 histidine kinase [Clostridium kluyveri]UZQ49240.1 ATP-binding protein [Clostridium kluyveri]